MNIIHKTEDTFSDFVFEVEKKILGNFVFEVQKLFLGNFDPGNRCFLILRVYCGGDRTDVLA